MGAHPFSTAAASGVRPYSLGEVYLDVGCTAAGPIWNVVGLCVYKEHGVTARQTNGPAGSLLCHDNRLTSEMVQHADINRLHPLMAQSYREGSYIVAKR
jgi:hypothetical protein